MLDSRPSASHAGLSTERIGGPSTGSAQRHPRGARRPSHRRGLDRARYARPSTERTGGPSSESMP